MIYGKPFDRKRFFMEIGDYIEKGWFSYDEVLNYTIRDLSEIKIGIESRQQEETVAQMGI